MNAGDWMLDTKTGIRHSALGARQTVMEYNHWYLGCWNQLVYGIGYKV